MAEDKKNVETTEEMTEVAETETEETKTKKKLALPKLGKKAKAGIIGGAAVAATAIAGVVGHKLGFAEGVRQAATSAAEVVEGTIEEVVTETTPF